MFTRGFEFDDGGKVSNVDRTGAHLHLRRQLQNPAILVERTRQNQDYGGDQQTLFLANQRSSAANKMPSEQAEQASEIYRSTLPAELR